MGYGFVGEDMGGMGHVNEELIHSWCLRSLLCSALLCSGVRLCYAMSCHAMSADSDFDGFLFIFSFFG